MEVDRCVLVLKREKEKLRLLEECSFVPPRDLEELRRHTQTGKDVMAVAMRDFHASREQPGLRLKREAEAKTAERAAAELLGEDMAAGAPSSATSSPVRTCDIYVLGISAARLSFTIRCRSDGDDDSEFK